MYEQFYGLNEKPFNLTPSPRFLYLSEGHKEALALLKYGVMERKGFILLTGEVGTGKTTMVRTLLDSLNSTVKYVLLSNPLLSQKDFVSYLALSTFGKNVSFKSKAHFLLVIEAYLKKAVKNSINFNLIIDEAHKLSFELLEEIRLLSNMETGDEKLINIFLVGQPELKEKLGDPRCRPLLQRISIRHNIPPLDLQETRDYVDTRLRVAGAKKPEQILSKTAVEAIYHFAGGYPREINVLADNALLLGYSKGIKKVGPSMIRECYEDLRLDTPTREQSIRETEHRKTAGNETEKRRKGETGKVEFQKTGPIWKWAAIVFLFLALLVAALGLREKGILSRFRALILSTYESATKNITRNPVSARNVMNKESQDLGEPNKNELQRVPIQDIGKITNDPELEEPYDETTTEKKTDMLETQEVPIVENEDSREADKAKTALEQPLPAAAHILEKKKSRVRLLPPKEAIP